MLRQTLEAQRISEHVAALTLARQNGEVIDAVLLSDTEKGAAAITPTITAPVTDCIDTDLPADGGLENLRAWFIRAVCAAERETRIPGQSAATPPSRPAPARRIARAAEPTHSCAQYEARGSMYCALCSQGNRAKRALRRVFPRS
jgi:hypothetical protein